MKKRILATVMSLAMASAVLAGCSDGSSSSSSSTDAASTTAEAETTEAAEETADAEASSDGAGYNIYGIYKSGDQTWFLNEGEAAKGAVEAQGGTFTYVDAKMSSEETLKAIDNAIANQADGIVICVPDQTMSQAVVTKCEEAGIAVVAADDGLEVDGEKIAPWIGIDGYNIGLANGEWMANYVLDNDLAGDESVGLLIMTMDTVSSCVPRTEGEYDKFKEMVPDYPEERIFYADYDGTTDKGNTTSAAVFTAHPEITTWLVMGANEEGTIGACRALETAGLDANACVVGLGAYLAKDEWNNKGADGTCMKASCYFSENDIGAGSINLVIDVIEGKEVEMSNAVPATVVTPENYKDVMGAAAE